MNPETNNPKVSSRISDLFRAAPARLWKTLAHNWPWKLLALFLALCLWAGLISQDATLTRERSFNDVPLNVTGAETLRRNNGLIVLSGLETENLNVRMRVEVPQLEYANVTYSNYNPRLDLTRLTEPGEHSLRVVTTSSSTYGTVEDISPSTIDVVVDEYVTNYRVPVSVNVTGEYPEGFHGSAISRDPSIVAVSGPRTVVDKIARVSVDYNASSLSPRAGVVRTAIPIRFFDVSGNEIEHELLEVTSAGVMLRTIILEQTLYPMRTVSISTSAITTGEPAEGYQLKRVTLSPSVLRVAGNEASLTAVEQLFAEAPVNIEGAEQSFTTAVKIKRPSDIVYLSTDAVTVNVELEPVTISRTFDNVRISARGLGSDLDVSLDERSVSAVLEGPQLTLEGLRSSRVSAYVDVTDLEEGEYELPVEIHVEDSATEDVRFAATPATVIVTITAE